MIRMVYNDLESARKGLEGAKRICVDIETDTVPAADKTYTLQWGLSYLADITHIGVYADTSPEEVYVFRMPVLPDSPKWDLYMATDMYQVHEARMEYVAFMQELLTRPEIMWIGHNVVFDMRSLGGHYGVTLHPTSKVWDTRVIAARCMMGVSGDPYPLGLSLYEQVVRWGWRSVFHEGDKVFYLRMKNEFRDNYHLLKAALAEKEDLFQPYRNSVTPTFESAIDAATESVFSHYAAMDVVQTYNLYLKQSAFVQKAVAADAPYGNMHVPHWPELLGLVKMEVNLSRDTCNSVIKGLKLDVTYAQDSLRRHEADAKRHANAAMALKDPTHDSDAWEQDYQMLLFFNAAIATVTDSTTFSNHALFYHWRHTTISLDKLLSWLSPTDDMQGYTDEELRGWLLQWAQWLQTLPANATRSVVNKTRPTTPPPAIMSTLSFCKRGMKDRAPEHQDYLASVKDTWFKRYYTSRTVVDNPLAMNIFKPYHLFVVCGVNIPDDTTIEYNWPLVTRRVMNSFKEFQRNGNAETDIETAIETAIETVSTRPETVSARLFHFETPAETDETVAETDETDDETAFQLPVGTGFPWAKAAMQTGGLSTGKKAMDFYLTGQGEDHPLTHFKNSLQADAWFKRTREFLEHATRDGRVHSVISRVTRTGRFSSTNPNLQNIDMGHFSGYFVPDDEQYVLLELDYANAENKTGAMVSGDPSFAMATEGGDFHSYQARIYWPEEWEAAKQAGDKAKLKAIRSRSKAVTFASAYGAGAYKISTMIGSTKAEAEAILANKDAAYPILTRRKQDAGNAVLRRVERGGNPAYISLWDASRVVVAATAATPNADFMKAAKSVSYKAWNYLQQGGVAQMVSRAIVSIGEYLREGGYKTTVAINVHDSIILHAYVAEVDDILPRIFQIMAEVVPFEMRSLTRPFIHFISEIGPENAFKWGYVRGRQYPLSFDHFYNQWGKHLLPEDQLALPVDKREAPTWVVNVAEGDTLEKEYERHKRKETLESNGIVVEADNRWVRVVQRIENLARIGGEVLEEINDLVIMVRTVYSLSVKVEDGDKTFGPLDYVNYMYATDALTSRGYDRSTLTSLPDYDTIVSMIERIEEKLRVILGSQSGNPLQPTETQVSGGVTGAA